MPNTPFGEALENTRLLEHEGWCISRRVKTTSCDCGFRYAPALRALAALVEKETTPARLAHLGLARITHDSENRPASPDEFVDEVVAFPRSAHLEMLNETSAFLRFGDDVFTVFAERGRLRVRYLERRDGTDARSANCLTARLAAGYTPPEGT